MIQRIYAALGRFVHWALTPAIIVASRNSVRVRALVITPEKEILLVRTWLGYQQWSLPGGGIARREDAAQAASREVAEETGIRVPVEAFQPLGKFSNSDSASPFTVNCQQAVIAKQGPRLGWYRRHEVLEVTWFNLDSLPSPRSKNVDRALTLLQHKQ